MMGSSVKVVAAALGLAPDCTGVGAGAPGAGAGLECRGWGANDCFGPLPPPSLGRGRCLDSWGAGDGALLGNEMYKGATVVDAA